MVSSFGLGQWTPKGRFRSRGSDIIVMTGGIVQISVSHDFCTIEAAYGAT
jgi:hypothetical protein